MQFSLLNLGAGVLLSEWTFIFFARAVFGKYINKWYSDFGIWALMSDVSSILIGIFIAMYLYRGPSFLILMGVAILVQWTHDFLFYMFVIRRNEQGKNGIIDILKPYADDAGIAALVGDSWMMISTLLFAYMSKNLPQYGQYFSILVSLYIIPYAIFQKPSIATL
jgi:hypothetical protein